MPRTEQNTQQFPGSRAGASRPGRVEPEKVSNLREAVTRLERALNSTEASDQTRIAALTAIVNGHAALVAADPNQRGRR